MDHGSPQDGGILKVQSLKFKVQSKNLEEDFSRG
jgi:hypothetical protein